MTKCSINVNSNGYEDIFMTWKSVCDTKLNKKAETKIMYANWFHLCNTMCVRESKCTQLLTVPPWSLDDG